MRQDTNTKSCFKSIRCDQATIHLEVIEDQSNVVTFSHKPLAPLICYIILTAVHDLDSLSLVDSHL